jgi:hypothetical protein
MGFFNFARADPAKLKSVELARWWAANIAAVPNALALSGFIAERPASAFVARPTPS